MQFTKDGGPPAVRVRDLVVDVPGRRLLDGADLDVGRSESVAVMGPSGSGKTTLLNCIAGLAPAASGLVEVAGHAMTGGTDRANAAVRLASIGIVFQFGELLPELTVGENVALPAMFARHRDAAARAADLLAAVGLAGASGRAVASLSGGEVQRVAVARALIAKPAVVLADEPTGALDEATTETVSSLLFSACRSTGAALVLVTHNPAVAAKADRLLRLGDGLLAAVAPGVFA